MLVLGANFLVMFVGWEGVGLCSYLLIGFWFRKKSAADAGKKAFVVNRIGDYAFILGMLLLFAQFGTLDFQGLAAIVAGMPVEAGMFGVLSIATLLLFIGATGKSAQIPLYTWLPDAMEGPTPVSALIHAATMVTAGVYMIGRNAVLFSHAPETMMIVAVIGAVTALMAGTIGLVQNDIKRVLAYSTVSQLGLMFLAMGVGAFGAGIFHLYTHAFFKALLFLGSGAVIHALHGEQDIRNMGGLEAVPADHLLDVPHRLAGDCRCPRPRRVLQQGRNPVRDVPRRARDPVAHRGADVAADGDLHVPPGVPDVPRRAAARGAGRAAGRRGTGAHGHAHGHAAAPHAHAVDAHPHGGLHDAPPAMAFALIVLALGSVLAGYIGVPHALGGHNQLATWLAPAFAADARLGMGQGAQAPAEAGQAEAAAGTEEAALELTLMAVSSADRARSASASPRSSG